MAVIVVATAFPAPEHREEVIDAFEAAIRKVHAEEDGCELYVQVLAPHPAGSPAKGTL